MLLTDYTDGVLRNLRDCMLLNAPVSSSRSTRSQEEQQQEGEEEAQAQQQQQQEQGEDQVRQASGQSAGQSCSEAGEELPWESGATAVRFLDWTDSLTKVESALGKAAPSLGRSIAAASHTSLDSLDRASNESRAPGVAPEERFDLLLGTGEAFCLWLLSMPGPALWVQPHLGTIWVLNPRARAAPALSGCC